MRSSVRRATRLKSNAPRASRADSDTFGLRRVVGHRTPVGPDHALISLLALNGLRVSEAIGADVEDLGLERGHRTLPHRGQRRQGRDRAARTADGAGHRPGGRRTLRRADLRRNRQQADRSPHGRPDRAPHRPPGGSPSGSDPTPCVMRSSPPLSTPACRRDVQEADSHADPRTTMRYDRARVSLDRHATYIVSRPSSPARAADTDPPALARAIAPERAIGRARDRQRVRRGRWMSIVKPAFGGALRDPFRLGGSGHRQLVVGVVLDPREELGAAAEPAAEILVPDPCTPPPEQPAFERPQPVGGLVRRV